MRAFLSAGLLAVLFSLAAGVAAAEAPTGRFRLVCQQEGSFSRFYDDGQWVEPPNAYDEDVTFTVDLPAGSARSERPANQWRAEVQGPVLHLTLSEPNGGTAHASYFGDTNSGPFAMEIDAPGMFGGGPLVIASVGTCTVSR